MKIVILDAKCATLNDLSFEKLKQFGELVIYDRTKNNQIDERIAGADIVLTNKTPISKEIINANSSIKFISVLATGFNIVDIDFAKEKHIPVSNVPSYSTESVVQHTFGLILNAASGISSHNYAVKNGDWTSYPDFSLCTNNLTELCGKTLGIIGYGSIGKRIAEVGKAFGMNVIVNTRTPVPGCVDKEYLFKNADVISLHCPLTPQNHHLIDEKAIAQMKNGVVIVNTARGGLIDEEAVAKGLQNGKIAFYCADVLQDEPPKKDNPIIKQKNSIITSHIAWATKEARQRLIDITFQNIQSFVNGSPINVVNQ